MPFESGHALLPFSPLVLLSAFKNTGTDTFGMAFAAESVRRASKAELSALICLCTCSVVQNERRMYTGNLLGFPLPPSHTLAFHGAKRSHEKVAKRGRREESEGKQTIGDSLTVWNAAHTHVHMEFRLYSSRWMFPAVRTEQNWVNIHSIQLFLSVLSFFNVTVGCICLWAKERGCVCVGLLTLFRPS